MSDIPILENEETWAQRVIDERQKGMYKVSYYMTGQTVAYKWFKTFNEASAFSLKINSGDVIEIKWYENETR